MTVNEKSWVRLGLGIIAIEGLFAILLVLGNLVLPQEVILSSARLVAGDHYADTHTIRFYAEGRPWLLGHLLPSLVFAVLGILQLLPALRHKGRGAWHRWIGRTFIVMALAAAVTGTLMTLKVNYSGPDEIVPSVFFSLALAVFCTMGLVRARQRDFRAHQDWMALALASGFGIVLARLYLHLLTSSTGLPANVFFGTILWMGSGSNIVLALAWINVRNRLRAGRRRTGAAAEMATGWSR